eukprot:443680-Pelagomonas_calceolata.AAC.2
MQRLNFFGGPNLSEEELKMIESMEQDEHLEDRIVSFVLLHTLHDPAPVPESPQLPYFILCLRSR